MLPHVLLVVLGQQCVQKRVDAAVGIRQARGQVVDVAFGFQGQGHYGLEQLPDPKGQEAYPEEEYDGEDQVEHLQGHQQRETNRRNHKCIVKRGEIF